jgi:hypothetical protein
MGGDRGVIMRKFLATACIVMIIASTAPATAAEAPDGAGESSYGYVPPLQKKSVGTAALLSVVPSFGAGLYYAEEYPMAISSSVAMAVGLGLFLDAQFRTHRSGEKISALTVMGSSWLLGVIYAPLSVHQRNKVVDETYGFTPYLDISHKKLYAGVGMRF